MSKTRLAAAFAAAVMAARDRASRCARGIRRRRRRPRRRREIVGGIHGVPRRGLDDVVRGHGVLHGDDDEAGGDAAGVDLDGVGGEASSVEPAQDLAPELVVAHARDDRGVAAELVEVARDVRRGAPEEEARGKGVPEGLADDGDALAGRRLDRKRRRPPRLGSASSKMRRLGRGRAIGSPDRDEGRDARARDGGASSRASRGVRAPAMDALVDIAYAENGIFGGMDVRSGVSQHILRPFSPFPARQDV